MKSAGNYAKSLVPLLITALYTIQSALSDGKVTNTEWAGIATGLIASLGAFIVPNTKTVTPAPMVAPSVTQPTPVTGQTNVPFTIKATDETAPPSI